MEISSTLPSILRENGTPDESLLSLVCDSVDDWPDYYPADYYYNYYYCCPLDSFINAA